MDGYSTLVAWLKVLLPLMALLLLSTLFLLSRNPNPIASIATLPFPQAEFDERLRSEQLTSPVFLGTTGSGDEVTVSANTMATRIGLNKQSVDFSAQIDLISGMQITLVSDQGQFDLEANISTFQGNVVIITSSGFNLASDEMIAQFDTLVLDSPGPVHGTGPLGTLDAGKMRLERKATDSTTHFFFTSGVKLIYIPEVREE